MAAGQYTYALYAILALLAFDILLNGGGIVFSVFQDDKIEDIVNSEDISKLEDKIDDIDYRLNKLSDIETKIDTIGTSIDLIGEGDTYVSNNETNYISITKVQFFFLLTISSIFGSLIGSLLSITAITKFILNKEKKKN